MNGLSNYRPRGVPPARLGLAAVAGVAVLTALAGAWAGGSRPLAAQVRPYPGINLNNITTPLPAAPTPQAIVGGDAKYSGSVPTGAATGEVLPLSLASALERGLAANLGVVSRGLDSQVAQAESGRSLSNLLPQIGGTVRHQTGSISLVQFGFHLPGFPEVIGPFSFQDARIQLNEQINRKGLLDYRSAKETQKAADLNFADARELVVVAVGAAYYQVVASTARVETAQAQLNASQSLESLATNQVKDGLTPSIDGFRSTVQRQTDQQRLVVYQAQLAKDKLSLGRLIGLPSGQAIALTTPVPFVPWNGPGEDDAKRLAYASRNDLKSAEAALKSAELARDAAGSERLPSLMLEGDYGRIGHNLGATDSTYTLMAGITVPIYEGGRIHSEVAKAQAVLDRRKAELADVKGKVDYDVSANFLDLRAAEASVDVAQKNVDLAEQTLAVAKDRFANGVTNNVEVVLAEQDVAAAHENYIASLFSHNYTKLALLRAMGQVEQGIKQFLSGQLPAGGTQ